MNNLEDHPKTIEEALEVLRKHISHVTREVRAEDAALSLLRYSIASMQKHIELLEQDANQYGIPSRYRRD